MFLVVFFTWCGKEDGWGCWYKPGEGCGGVAEGGGCGYRGKQ